MLCINEDFNQKFSTSFRRQSEFVTRRKEVRKMESGRNSNQYKFLPNIDFL